MPDSKYCFRSFRMRSANRYEHLDLEPLDKELGNLALVHPGRYFWRSAAM
jgi:hypothetical protein